MVFDSLVPDWPAPVPPAATLPALWSPEPRSLVSVVPLVLPELGSLAGSPELSYPAASPEPGSL